MFIITCTTIIKQNFFHEIHKTSVLALCSPSVSSQVLTALGSQLCALWGKEADVGEPPNFRVYLDAMLAFTGHPSLHIYNFTNGLWGQLFRHEHIPQSKTLQAVLPTWITIVSRMASSLRCLIIWEDFFRIFTSFFPFFLFLFLREHYTLINDHVAVGTGYSDRIWFRTFCRKNWYSI